MTLTQSRNVVILPLRSLLDAIMSMSSIETSTLFGVAAVTWSTIYPVTWHEYDDCPVYRDEYCTLRVRVVLQFPLSHHLGPTNDQRSFFSFFSSISLYFPLFFFIIVPLFLLTKSPTHLRPGRHLEDCLVEKASFWQLPALSNIYFPRGRSDGVVEWFSGIFKPYRQLSDVSLVEELQSHVRCQMPHYK